MVPLFLVWQCDYIIEVFYIGVYEHSNTVQFEYSSWRLAADEGWRAPNRVIPNRFGFPTPAHIKLSTPAKATQSTKPLSDIPAIGKSQFYPSIQLYPI